MQISEVAQVWRTLSTDSKRKYIEMSEQDKVVACEIRISERKRQLIAKVEQKMEQLKDVKNLMAMYTVYQQPNDWGSYQMQTGSPDYDYSSISSYEEFPINSSSDKIDLR